MKPRIRPADPAVFVESLKHHQHLDEVEAVGLVVQNLLVDPSGKIFPSPLFSDLQFRQFTNTQSGTSKTEIIQYELSRRLLLTDPQSGGLVQYDQTAPAYLSAAGNDYDYATSIEEADAPVVVPLRTRCSQCHFESLRTLMTYSIHYIPPVPKVRILNSSDNERSLYVASRKYEREDYKSLFSSPSP